MRKMLYITVFISGMASLAVEMAASRLLGNYFGTSNLVWASIIGLILIYLTIGYFIGGKWADESPEFETFFSILAWASITIAFVPLISRPILRFAAVAFDNLSMGNLIGSFLVVMILFVVPVTLLGTASPFAIRLAIQDSRQTGTIAGRVYAISTLGSFVGTFLSVIILIPLIGTYRTFLAISAILFIVTIIGMGLTVSWKRAFRFLWIPIVLILLGLFGTPGTDKVTDGMIYETESSYNYIQVLEKNGYHLLRLNEGQGVHSIYNPSQLNYFGPWEQVLVAPFFNNPPVNPENIKSMAIIGLAGGTTARQATVVYPDIKIDGYEIDPKIIDTAQDYFGLDLPNLDVYIQDGRWGLSSSTNSYDIISVDAYRPPYIPWHMTTKEFFQEVFDHLNPNGVMVINVGRGPSDRRIINALGSTILSVFPSIHVMDLPDSFNSIVFATVMPSVPENFQDNFITLQNRDDVHPLLLDTMLITYQNLKSPPNAGDIFTDDLAPIEWLTNSLIVDFFLNGQLETIQ